MARKKRLEEVKQAPGIVEQPKEPVFYEDAFQQKANANILNASRKLEGKGKTVLYAVAAVAVLAVLVGVFYAWNRRSTGAAQTALGKAIETAEAPVTTQPLPPTYTGKAFKTEKERSEAAITEFNNVANTYGGDVREKAQYFAAVNRLNVDRNAAIGDLENLAKSSGETGSLAKFALAQAKQGDGKLDEAVAIYSDLAKSNDSVIARDTLNFEIASIYDKQGKKKEAADIYYNIAKPASEAKDADGKSIPMTTTAREAKDKLEAIDPTRAAEIKEDLSSQLPLGM